MVGCKSRERGHAPNPAARAPLMCSNAILYRAFVEYLIYHGEARELLFTSFYILCPYLLFDDKRFYIFNSLASICEGWFYSRLKEISRRLLFVTNFSLWGSMGPGTKQLIPWYFYEISKDIESGFIKEGGLRGSCSVCVQAWIPKGPPGCDPRVEECVNPALFPMPTEICVKSRVLGDPGGSPPPQTDNSCQPIHTLRVFTIT